MVKLRQLFFAFSSGDCMQLRALRSFSPQLVEACTQLDKGAYQRTLKILNDFEPANLSEKVFQLALLIGAQTKQGVAPSTDALKFLELNGREFKVYAYYIYFSYFFWVDAKKAEYFLHKLKTSAIKHLLVGHILQAFFLFCHMQTINSKSTLHYRAASFIYKIAGFLSARETYTIALPYRIIFSTFPYTALCAKKASFVLKNFEELKKKCPHESYYNVLFHISCLYSACYSGNLTLGLVVAKEFQELNEKFNLERYQQLVGIMQLLPLALHGYSPFIWEEIDKILNMHESEKASPLINSQFFRAAALIALSGRRFSQAGVLIKKAGEFRSRLMGFDFWSEIDAEVLRQSTAKIIQKEKIGALIGVDAHSWSLDLNLSAFLIELYSLIVKDPSAAFEVQRQVKGLFEDFYECNVAIVSSESDSVHRSAVVFDYDCNTKFICVARNERFVLLERTAPILKICLENFFERIRLLKAANAASRDILVGRLAAGVAHDIRAPLLALKLGLQELCAVGEGADLISKAIKRIEAIASGLLNVKPEDKEIAFSLQTAVENIIAEKKLLLNAHQVTLHFDANHCPDVKVVGDSTIFQRLFSNILDNAVESFIAPKLSKIISCSLKLHEANKIELRLQDNGDGMLPSVASNVFFEKTTSKCGGHGIGLYNAKATLAEWGATINFYSVMPSGTLFTILFKVE